jgi:TatD DNase family protein
MTKKVDLIINIGIAPEDFEKCLNLQKEFPANIKNAIGIHPELSPNLLNYVETFKSQFRDHIQDFVGVGEIGLDFLAVKDHAQRIESEKVFRSLLDFATEIQKPVIIHCRNAEKQAIKILKEYPHLSGVLLHCFGGPEKFVSEALDMGWYFTIPTSIFFKKIHQDLAARVPIDRILLESDSPFLAPSPDISMNEPQYVVRVAQEIAKIKEISFEEVASITTQNVKHFFKF